MNQPLNNLEKLLYLRGVAAEYHNYSGERVVIPHDVRLKCLEVVGYDVEDEQAVRQAIFELDARPWKSWLKPFNIVSLGESEFIDIRVHPDELEHSFKWQLTTEAGDTIRGILIPAELPEVGEYYIEGVRYTAHRHTLPDLTMGYHQIKLSGLQREAQAVLAVAPRRCFEPQQRPWGISCQLYTLRSQRNWGMGDFTDLVELITLAAAAGMDLVALNPLHAPHMAGGDFASPYSPSDRRFLNPLYIDPEQVRDFSESEAVNMQLTRPDFQRELAALRALPLIDYEGVAALKYHVFDQMFQHFLGQHLERSTDRAREFVCFVQRNGASLAAFSLHESAHSGLTSDSASDPRFHQYLQWLAQGQLQRCQTLAIERGMKVGLMRDLAVGAVRSGAEVDCNPEIFCNTATIGAPPDPFAQEGQNWNLPVLDPVALKRDNYRHFIDLLQANMSCCGALRFDHVMGMMRLWWCLPGVAGGAYVYYPMEDLLTIIRLESHRNRCVVVGEDMGVVPDELRVKMTAMSIYSSKVFYFERTAEQQFIQPQDHQVDAALMVTNHDVATLAGWWHGTDLQIRQEIGLLDVVLDLPELLQQRQEDKARVLAWLKSLQLLPASWAGCGADLAEDKFFDIMLCSAILTANARSCSRILLFQLDDLQLMREPVNIPGTDREYPNWRRKQKLDSCALFADPKIQVLLASIYQERKL